MDNIVWHHGEAQRRDRERILGQRGVVLWFTGLSGSGKSTIAVEVEKRLLEDGKLPYRLDGDNVRHGLNGNLEFSIEDRRENIRRISEVSKLYADTGIITLASFISPTLEIRGMAREIIGEDFVEVYVKAPLAICEKRDPKGLYKKARAGEIKNFTGIDSPYEEPADPEVILMNEDGRLEEVVDEVMIFLRKKGVI